MTAARKVVEVVELVPDEVGSSLVSFVRVVLTPGVGVMVGSSVVEGMVVVVPGAELSGELSGELPDELWFVVESSE